ncbi:hypothetical protein BDF22DRAFT_745279 [Syncephalis plumigaleata]|nr:hypothetical protein BDF22DRAFT_745279 [Syncephalis plumigaleata]
MSILILRNTVICGRVLVRNYRIIYLFGFLQSFVGNVCAISVLIRLVTPWLIQCTTLSYIMISGITISEPTIYYILLAKACAIQKHRFAAPLGKVLIFIASVAQGAGIYFLHLHAQTAVSCAWIPSLQWIIVKCVVDLVNITFFSVCFLSVMQRYRAKADQNTERVFRKLIRDGYLYAGCVMLIKLVITLVILLSSFGAWSTHLMAVDYIAASTLLTYQLTHSRDTISTRSDSFERGTPKTRARSIIMPVKQDDLPIMKQQSICLSIGGHQPILSPFTLRSILSPILSSSTPNATPNAQMLPPTNSSFERVYDKPQPRSSSLPRK